MIGNAVCRSVGSGEAEILARVVFDPQVYVLDKGILRNVHAVVQHYTFIITPNEVVSRIRPVESEIGFHTDTCQIRRKIIGLTVQIIIRFGDFLFGLFG